MLHITLFGPTSASIADGEPHRTDLGGSKPRQILEILALADGSPVAKDKLADLLWDGEPPRSYVGTLESYICVLRRRLGCAKGRGAAITTTTSGYLLDPSQVRVDLVECRALLARASKADPAAALELTQEALAMCGKPLLASEPYAAWANRERDSFVQALTAACVSASRHAVQLGQAELAVGLARTAADLDRFAEDAWQQLMRALAATGKRCAALRVYLDLRQSMIDELGIEPAAASHDLYLEILTDGPGVQQEERSDPTELRTLLGLLRDALERIPGVEPTKGDSGLSYVAVKALAVA